MTGRTRALIRFLFREMVRDRAMLLAAAVLVGSLLLAVGNGIAARNAHLASLSEVERYSAGKLDEAKTTARAVLAGEVEKPRYWNDPTDVRGFGYYLLAAHALKPPTSLEVLTIGASDLLPRMLRVGPGTQVGLASAYDVESPDRLSLGRIDASFVIVFLLPLVIAAAGHGALASERESGRLPLLAMHGLSPRKVALWRLAMRSLTLAVLGLLAIVLPLAFSDIELGRTFVAWLAVAVAYGALWVGLTALVVAFSGRADTAAATLGALWVVLVLVLPWSIAFAAERAYPTPSRVAQVLGGRAATDDASTRGGDLLGRFLQDHPELTSGTQGADPDQYMAQQIMATRMVDQGQAASDALFDRRMAERQRLVDRFAWLSPPLLAQAAMIELAGTGLTRQRAFQAQTRGYVAALRRYFEPRALRQDKSFTDWDGWPRFAWREPPQSRAITAASLQSAGLLLAAVVLMALAFARLGRISHFDRLDR